MSFFGGVRDTAARVGRDLGRKGAEVAGRASEALDRKAASAGEDLERGFARVGEDLEGRYIKWRAGPSDEERAEALQKRIAMLDEGLEQATLDEKHWAQMRALHPEEERKDRRSTRRGLRREFEDEILHVWSSEEDMSEVALFYVRKLQRGGRTKREARDTVQMWFDSLMEGRYYGTA